MHLIVGLGNPGDKYARNRHNVGMMAVDDIARRAGNTQFKSKFLGTYADVSLDGERCILLKPETFMNRSGDSVAQAAKFFKIAPENIIVIYDELDLAPGKLRVKRSGGNGGHNGLRSIDPQIGTDYVRVRIGIGHPGHKDLVTRHVLGDFAKADSQWLDPLLRAIADHIGLLLADDQSTFMNRIAESTREPANSTKAVEPNKAAAPKPSATQPSAPAPEGPMAAMLRKLKRQD